MWGPDTPTCPPGKSYTMIGKDSSPQSLGVVPCAISWLFRLIEERKERTGTRFSVRVSAAEVCGPDESPRDLLAEVAAGSLQDAQSPGMYLREDPACGAQVGHRTRGHGPGWGQDCGSWGAARVASGRQPWATACAPPSPLPVPSCQTRASFGRPRQRRQPCTWTRHWRPAAPAGLAAAHTCSSHCMSTSTAWRSAAGVEVGVGSPPPPPPWCLARSAGSRCPGAAPPPACPVLSVSGGRSRLHLIDLGGCEGAPSRGGEAPGGSSCLPLLALGSVILALVSGAKHVPYR